MHIINKQINFSNKFLLINISLFTFNFSHSFKNRGLTWEIFTPSEILVRWLFSDSYRNT